MPHPDTDSFLELLDQIDLPGRYYALTDRAASGSSVWSDRRRDHEKVLTEAGLPVRYFGDQQFFRHEVYEGEVEFKLHLIFLSGTVELGIYIHTPRGDLGGTVHGLARRVTEMRGAGPDRVDPYPFIPYASRDEQLEAVRFARELFTEIKSAIVRPGHWT